jgi:hypothetical protein
VLRLVARQLSNQEIAAQLAISRRTVETHMRTLFRKTGVTRRAQLAALYPGDGSVVGVKAELPPSTTDNASALPLSPQRDELADCEEQLRAYATVVQGLADRQFSLFEERIEITAMVGEQDGQDVVIERRWSRPRPYLIYRIVGPIVTWPGGPSQAAELAPECMVDGQDTDVDVHVVRAADSRPLIMVLFQPGLQVETEWVLRYQSPKLWQPLRDTGSDTLTWATTTFDQRYRTPRLNELTLKVIFPNSWAGARLTERSNLGVVRSDRLPTGQTQIIWHQHAPTAGKYHWLLHGSHSS